MAPIVFSWRHLAICDLTSVYTNTFVDNLIRLSQSKKELHPLIFSTKFFWLMFMFKVSDPVSS